MNQRKKNGLFSLKELDIIAAFLPQGLLKQMTTGMGIYISTIRDNVKYDAIITNRQKENSGCKETFQQPFLQQQISSVEFYQYSVFIAMFQAVVQLRNKTINAISSRPQDFISITFPFSRFYPIVLTSFHRISQTSSKFGQGYPVKKNQVEDLTQTEKYFE